MYYNNGKNQGVKVQINTLLTNIFGTLVCNCQRSSRIYIIPGDLGVGIYKQIYYRRSASRASCRGGYFFRCLGTRMESAHASCGNTRSSFRRQRKQNGQSKKELRHGAPLLRVSAPRAFAGVGGYAWGRKYRGRFGGDMVGRREGCVLDVAFRPACRLA